MATDLAQKANLPFGGLAMKRMQELAQALYDSTPGIQEEVPRHASKILANVKKEDKKAEKRALNFVAEGAALRKGGTIEKKDLTVAMSAEDWETKYKEVWDKYLDEKRKTETLKERMVTKQERYIGREQEYRKTIEMIEQQIEQHSTKPLKIIQQQDENQLLLQGIDTNQPDQQELLEKEKKLKLRNEMHIDQKNVKEIHFNYDKIMETITGIQGSTAKELWKQRSEIWTTLDKKLEDIKAQLKAEIDKKKENHYDYKEKEKELNEHLETMTQIAQKIDDENRGLMKKNSELKIQYLSQENDRDLLLKQLIYQKKDSTRLKKLLEEKKKDAESLRNLDENNIKVDQSKANLQSRGAKQSRIQSGIPGNQNNISGLNNSRRNISLGSAAMIAAGVNRPKTAALGGGGLPRPPTAAFKNNLGGRLGTAGMGAGGFGTSSFPQGINMMGQRAVSAQIGNNPRVKRYEDLINRLKKMITMEKQSLRMVRTMASKEIEIKNYLEKILRQCVDDVKAEIAKKRSENKTIYYSKGKRGTGDLLDEKNLTQQEREKIIEVLLSQERVLTLLYDKTFPPRPATAKVGVKTGFMSQSGQGIADGDQMRQFNYYGQINEMEEEEDVQKLEKEIDDVMRNRLGTANTYQSNDIINIQKGGRQRGKSSQPGAINKANIIVSPNKEMGEIGDDIYEDEELSNDDDDF